MLHLKKTAYTAMLDAVRLTFENMAFVEVTEQFIEAPLDVPLDSAWASILIHDPILGELFLILPQNLLTSMAADMFGIEIAEITELQRRDIIAETLNTVAGLFMNNLLPAEQAYRLGLPEHGSGPHPEMDKEALVWNLQIEGIPLRVVANGNGFCAADN